MSIEDLELILKPPTNPEEVPTELDLIAFGREVTPLPGDYAKFIRRYGTGCIDDFIWMFNPVAQNENLCMRKQVPRQMWALQEAAIATTHLPSEFSAGLSNLLPLGLTDNGDFLLGQMLGNADSWPTVVVAGRLEMYELFDLGLTEFLCGILSGSLQCSVFPSDFPSNNPEFRPIS